MRRTVPDKMRAVVLERYQGQLSAAMAGLKVAERPVPALSRGQVLVQVEAASCNPSDLLLLQGKYGALKRLPTVPGWEGAGTVVASGPGWLTRWLVGKRVACGVQGDRHGTWAEYVVANAHQCIPVKRQLPIEQAAGLIINPLTALGLLDVAKRQGHRAAVSTAAAGQLGRMILAIAAKRGYPMIHVVRREEQVDLLKSLGAEHVLNSSNEDFWARFGVACRRLGATAAFEAVGGTMAGDVINSMPAGSAVYLYGTLSGDPCAGIDPTALIFHGKSLSGFYLARWLQSHNLLSNLRTARMAQQLLIDGTIETKVQRRVSLDEAADGLQQYVDHMTDGKVLIMPHKNG